MRKRERACMRASVRAACVRVRVCTFPCPCTCKCFRSTAHPLLSFLPSLLFPFHSFFPFTVLSLSSFPQRWLCRNHKRSSGERTNGRRKRWERACVIIVLSNPVFITGLISLDTTKRNFLFRGSKFIPYRIFPIVNGQLPISIRLAILNSSLHILFTLLWTMMRALINWFPNDDSSWPLRVRVLILFCPQPAES